MRSFRCSNFLEVHLTDQPILHRSVGLGHDGSCELVMYSGHEIGSHEERLYRMFCQYPPVMRQLEESKASHRVAHDFTF